MAEEYDITPLVKKVIENYVFSSDVSGREVAVDEVAHMRAIKAYNDLLQATGAVGPDIARVSKETGIRGYVLENVVREVIGHFDLLRAVDEGRLL